ncbi:hypothetical protein A6A12_0698 [Vibrio anguillarum]|nr:hypothetical protein A6A12_0698 [Vibrio anguillarum]
MPTAGISKSFGYRSDSHQRLSFAIDHSLSVIDMEQMK